MSKNSNNSAAVPSQEHTIRLTSDGSVHRGLIIYEAYSGERDKKTNNLIREGGVEFRSPARKAWWLPYSQFSFVIGEREEPKAKPALKRAA